MGNDSITAFRARELLRRFLGIFSPRFSKPKLELLGQMPFGIQVARDTLVSEIARSLQEGILSKKTQERLERHLRADGLDDKVHGSLLCDAAPSIHDDTPVVIDPTDVQKPYAERMPYLDQVRVDARQAARAPGRRATSRRREMARRREADDAADDAEGGVDEKGALGGRAGLRHALARRGHDTVRPAVVQAGAYAAPRLPEAEGHGRTRRRGRLLRGCVARQEGQARGARQPRRQGLAQDVRGPGVLLLCDRGRPEGALRAARTVEGARLRPRGARRPADGVRAADRIARLRGRPGGRRSPLKPRKPRTALRRLDSHFQNWA